MTISTIYVYTIMMFHGAPETQPAIIFSARQARDADHDNIFHGAPETQPLYFQRRARAAAATATHTNTHTRQSKGVNSDKVDLTSMMLLRDCGTIWRK